MGQKHLRIVLDTNVIISSCVLGKRLSIICEALESNKITLVLSNTTLNELLTTLTYSKFKLSKLKIDALMLKILTHSEVIDIEEDLQLQKDICRDTDDIKFLECAIVGSVDYLVTGDKDLLSIGTIRGIQIISPAQFIEILQNT